MITQRLDFGPIQMERRDEEASLYMLSGKKMYFLGATDGRRVPIGVEHLVGEMGGLWAHPVKFVDGLVIRLHEGDTTTPLTCHEFVGHLSDATLYSEHAALRIARTDFVAEHDAALFSLLSITNTGTEAWTGIVGAEMRWSMRGCWFGGWEHGEALLHREQHFVTVTDTLWQGRWGAAYGSVPAPESMRFGEDEGKATAELRWPITLALGATQSWEILLTVDHQRGETGARQLWATVVGHGERELAAKRARYQAIAWEGVQISTPDQKVRHEYALAKLNLHMLYADYGPYLPGFFLAGVPEFPQLFGCDTAYTTAGAVAAGFREEMKSALLLLGERARMACGRVPHELTTNGRTFNPGNTQETPQFALAVWDYVRWTGDLEFLRLMYPVCREGVMEYVSALWDFDGDGYPWGDAMVERPGMGSLKLDSACYLYAAWHALDEMATVLGRAEAADYRARAADWLVRFERQWWLPDEQLYADSLHTDLRPQLDGHWTQVVPIQLGIASPERSALVLDELHRSFVNEYGLVHTRGREERVWTLPTGLLALADVRLGRVEAAVEQLHNIARTTQSGMLGAFEELIPSGLCFMQLWSAAMYVQCVVEGLLGLTPAAHRHELRMFPALPAAWPEVTISNLEIGTHLLDLCATHAGATITHQRGLEPLHLKYHNRGMLVATIECTGNDTETVTLEQQEELNLIHIALPPRTTVTIILEETHARVHLQPIKQRS